MGTLEKIKVEDDRKSRHRSVMFGILDMRTLVKYILMIVGSLTIVLGFGEKAQGNFLLILIWDRYGLYVIAVLFTLFMLSYLYPLLSRFEVIRAILPITVAPNVYNKSFSEAKEILNSVCLRCEVNTLFPEDLTNELLVVVKQNPSPGTIVHRNRIVSFVVQRRSLADCAFLFKTRRQELLWAKTNHNTFLHLFAIRFDNLEYPYVYAEIINNNNIVLELKQPSSKEVFILDNNFRKTSQDRYSILDYEDAKKEWRKQSQLRILPGQSRKLWIKFDKLSPSASTLDFQFDFGTRGAAFHTIPNVDISHLLESTIHEIDQWYTDAENTSIPKLMC